MTRTNWLCLTLFCAILAFAFYCGQSRAQSVFNVSHNGVPAFCAPNLVVSNGVYNFIGECSTPPPPVDPGAYTSALVTWITHQQTRGMTDVTRFSSLFGRSGFNTPAVPIAYPYISGTEVSLPDNTEKYYRFRIDVPLNAGTLSHFVKTDSYQTTVPGVRLALVAPGAPWPTGAATSCYAPLAVNNQPALWINPGPANRSKCSVAPGTSVDLLIDATQPNARGTIGVSMN